MATFLSGIKLPVAMAHWLDQALTIKSWRFWTVAILTALAIGLSWQLITFYNQAFYPQTYINGVAVGDLTVAEATTLLGQQRPLPAPFTLVLTNDQTFIASDSAQLAAVYDYNHSLQQIFTTTHQGNWWHQFQRLAGLTHESYATTIDTNPVAIDQFITSLAAQINQPGKKPAISLATSGNPQTLTVEPGKSGLEVDRAATRQAIATELETWAQAKRDPSAWLSAADTPTKLTVSTVITTTAPPLTPDQIVQTQQAAKALVGKRLNLKVQNYHFTWDDRQLVSFILPPNQLDTPAITAALEKINHELPGQAENAAFDYNPDTLKVTKFFPGKDGLALNQAESLQQITTTITSWLQAANTESLTQDLTLPAAVQPPEITLGKTNKLGINQQVGFGESFYQHSIPSRIHNVAITAERINFTLIKPGEEFSFNKTLGEVSAATGYQPAYVISKGQTVLGDGGGVCQVSSTLFRAAMNAGLDITRRLPHSYRVSYYELNSQAGFDATVYSGNVDFRFINDTPGYLLIATQTDSSKLWMKVELYGTSDGRTATITDYKAWGATPPKPTQYIPDASLPPGKKKQIDWSASGLKTSFVYTVKDAAGAVKQQETYTSNYQSWAAKYLVGP